MRTTSPAWRDPGYPPPAARSPGAGGHLRRGGTARARRSRGAHRRRTSRRTGRRRVTGAPSGSTCCGSCPARWGGARSRPWRRLRGLIDLAPPTSTCGCSCCEPFAAAHPDLVAALPHRGAARSTGGRGPARVAGRGHLARRPDARRSTSSTTPGAPRPPRRRAPVRAHAPRPAAARARAPPTAGSSGPTSARAVPAAVRAARRVAVPERVRARHGARPLRPPPDRVVVDPARRAERDRRATRRATCSSERYGLDGPWSSTRPSPTPTRTTHAARRGVRAACAPTTRTRSSCSPAARARARRRSRPGSTRLGLRGPVRRLGRDPGGRRGRPVLELAAVVAVPSRYEGFGLPGRSRPWRPGRRSWPPTPRPSPRSSATPGVLVDPGDVDGLGGGASRACWATRPSGTAWPRPVGPGRPRTPRPPTPTASPTSTDGRLRLSGVGPNGSRRAALVGWATLWVRHRPPRRWPARPVPAAGCPPGSPAACCSRASSRWSWCSASPSSSTPATTATNDDLGGVPAARRPHPPGLRRQRLRRVAARHPRVRGPGRHPHPRRRRASTSTRSRSSAWAPTPPSTATSRTPATRAASTSRLSDTKLDYLDETYEEGETEVRGRRGPACSGWRTGRTSQDEASDARDHHR